MKTVRNFRPSGTADREDVFKRTTKLAPNRKSGKERRTLYAQLDDEEDAPLDYGTKRESAFDYLDDESE